jgi:hypothetical protein
MRISLVIVHTTVLSLLFELALVVVFLVSFLDVLGVC